MEALADFLRACVELYLKAPSFFNWIVPLLIGWALLMPVAGWKLARRFEKSEKDGLKAANDALKNSNDVLKDRATVLEERVKLAKEQAEDAQKKAQDFKDETEELRKKSETSVSKDELNAAFIHLDVKASNVLNANTAVSSTLSKPIMFYGGGPAIEIRRPREE